MPLFRFSVPDCTSNFGPFEKSLAETIAWCEPRAKEDRGYETFRTPSLQPSLLIHPERETVVSGVVRSRSHQLKEPLAQLSMRTQGRLLVFFPDDTLSDGAATGATNWFFDYDNVAPWDTWVGFFREEQLADHGRPREYLISWVPGPWVDRVSFGITLNPEECLHWLDDTPTNFPWRMP